MKLLDVYFVGPTATLVHLDLAFNFNPLANLTVIREIALTISHLHLYLLSVLETLMQASNYQVSVHCNVNSRISAMPFCERLSVVISNGMMAGQCTVQRQGGLCAGLPGKGGQAGRSRLVEAREVERVP